MSDDEDNEPQPKFKLADKFYIRNSIYEVIYVTISRVCSTKFIYLVIRLVQLDEGMETTWFSEKALENEIELDKQHFRANDRTFWVEQDGPEFRVLSETKLGETSFIMYSGKPPRPDKIFKVREIKG